MYLIIKLAWGIQIKSNVESVFIFGTLVRTGDKMGKFDCSVCMQTLTNRCVLSPCLHVLCKKCVKNSLEKNDSRCVLCRTNVTAFRYRSQDFAVVEKRPHYAGSIEVGDLQEYPIEQVLGIGVSEEGERVFKIMWAGHDRETVSWQHLENGDKVKLFHCRSNVPEIDPYDPTRTFLPGEKYEVDAPTVLEGGKYACPYDGCAWFGKCMTKKSDMMDHIFSIHGKNEFMLVACNTCSKTFHSQKSMMKHTRKYHSEPQKKQRVG